MAVAIMLARRDGVNRTAAALRLDGSKLKRQMTTKVGTAKAIGAPPSFVELLAFIPPKSLSVLTAEGFMLPAVSLSPCPPLAFSMAL